MNVQQTRDSRKALEFQLSRVIFVLIVLGVFGFLVWQGRRIFPLPETRTLLVYSCSGMEPVMEQALFPAFQKKWMEEQGGRVEFAATFAGSGQVAQQIIDRFPAEVAILASEMDSLRLAVGGTVHQPAAGALARTPMVIAVREGNPRGIADFQDLSKPGVEVVHPDPFTSGAGQWALLAVYGSTLRSGLDIAAARNRLDSLWRNVVAAPSSNKAALREFEQGRGDVVITYEASLLPRPGGQSPVWRIVHPRSTILAEVTAVPVPINIHDDQREVVEAFLQYVHSPEAQATLVEYGFHPVAGGIPGREDFGVVEDLFELANLGGAAKARMEIVEPFLRARVAAEASKGER